MVEVLEYQKEKTAIKPAEKKIGRRERKTSLPIHNIPGNMLLHDRRGGNNMCQDRGGKCTYKQ